MSEAGFEEVMELADAIYRDADEFNSMTWHGPHRDALRETAEFIWGKAFAAGYRKGALLE